MDSLFGFIHILYETDNALRLMVLDMFDFLLAFIFINDRQRRVQISSLMQTALDLILFKPGPVKYSIVRQKIYSSPGFLRLSHHWQKTILQLQGWDAALIPVFIDIAASLHRHMHMCRQGIYNRRANPVQTAAGLIGIIVKLTARMKCGKDKPLRTDAFLMHSDRDSPSIV